MHHEIEFNLSGSSLATVLTDLHNQVAFRKKKPSEEQPEAHLLMTRKGGRGGGGLTQRDADLKTYNLSSKIKVVLNVSLSKTRGSIIIIIREISSLKVL